MKIEIKSRMAFLTWLAKWEKISWKRKTQTQHTFWELNENNAVVISHVFKIIVNWFVCIWNYTEQSWLCVNLSGKLDLSWLTVFGGYFWTIFENVDVVNENESVRIVLDICAIIASNVHSCRFSDWTRRRKCCSHCVCLVNITTKGPCAARVFFVSMIWHFTHGHNFLVWVEKLSFCFPCFGCFFRSLTLFSHSLLNISASVTVFLSAAFPFERGEYFDRWCIRIYMRFNVVA